MPDYPSYIQQLGRSKRKPGAQIEIAMDETEMNQIIDSKRRALRRQAVKNFFSWVLIISVIVIAVGAGLYYDYWKFKLLHPQAPWWSYFL